MLVDFWTSTVRSVIEPTGTGTFTADVDRSVVLGEGDVVRLSDLSWADTAQAMVIGEIASIEVNDREPLRNTITVVPRYQVQYVSYVTLIIPKITDEVTVESGEERAP